MTTEYVRESSLDGDVSLYFNSVQPQPTYFLPCLRQTEVYFTFKTGLFEFQNRVCVYLDKVYYKPSKATTRHLHCSNLSCYMWRRVCAFKAFQFMSNVLLMFVRLLAECRIIKLKREKNYIRTEQSQSPRRWSGSIFNKTWIKFNQVHILLGRTLNNDILDSHTNNQDIMPDFTLCTTTWIRTHYKSYDWYEHISRMII